MSQEKVDKYKKEKYARKHNKKKSNAKKIVSYVVATLIAIAFVVYIGYSVAVATGVLKQPQTTTYAKMSDDEIESLRNKLIQDGDSNVKVETSATDENATTVATKEKETKADEKATTVEEATKAK